MGVLFHYGWIIAGLIVIGAFYQRSVKSERERIVREILKDAQDRRQRQDGPKEAPAEERAEELVGAGRSSGSHGHGASAGDTPETQSKGDADAGLGSGSFESSVPFETTEPVGHYSWLLRGLMLAGGLALLFLLIRPLFMPAPEIVGPVVAVFDGDTIEVLGKDKRTTRIRLYGIDAPENGQPFGETAKQYASRLAFGKEVRVFVKDKDRYGRLVGEVRIGRTDMNEEMVNAGLAWAYRHYTDQYVSQEETARRTRRGLWGDSQPMAPWEWRRGRGYPGY